MCDQYMLIEIDGPMLAEGFSANHRQEALSAGHAVARLLARRQWTERFVADHYPLEGVKLTRNAGGYAIKHIVWLLPEPEGDIAILTMLDVDGRKAARLKQSRSVGRAV